MALDRVKFLDRLEITEDGTLQVRHATYIVEDGKRITEPSYHRQTFAPGNDIPSDIVGFERIALVRDVIWTPDVIKAYQDKLEAARAEAGFPTGVNRAE